MTRKAREARPKGPADKTQQPDKLTGKQRAFAEHYAASGNATEAARAAGYAGNAETLSQVGSENLRKPQVARYIASLAQAAQSSRIVTREERQQFWTSTMRGEVHKGEAPRFADRLKASELLGKAQADFVDRHELTGKDGAPIQQETALTLEGKSIEELTALYKSWTR